MLRILAGYILITSLLLQTGFKSLLLLHYELKKDYFAKELCEKKDIPDNCCKGTCYLNKEIKEQDERENSQGPIVNVKYEIGVFDISTANFIFYHEYSQTLIIADKPASLSTGYLSKLLRPPLA